MAALPGAGRPPLPGSNGARPKEPPMKPVLLDLLRCQQCLGRLVESDQALICTECGISFPICSGLVFMGYPRVCRDGARQVIAVEKAHQTDLNDLKKDIGFAYPSWRVSTLAIRVLQHIIGDSGQRPVAVDVGCGGAPMSMLLARAGFETFRCELDPNSCFSGLLWEDASLGVGKHIVCDATVLPFSNQTVDVVFCKEFVHHIVEYSALFKEVSRVLRVGGHLVMIEPTLALVSGKDDHPGHHYQTMGRYFRALADAGFRPERYYLYFYGPSRRLRFLNPLKRHLHGELSSMSATGRLSRALKRVVQRMIGGTNVVFLRKASAGPTGGNRPVLELVDPALLTIGPEYLADPRLREFPTILEQVLGEAAHCGEVGDIA
jgi:SAM-dependent methyltransferase